jgi:DNA invertase Pin-like site-specific DNA recombinase
LILENLDRLSRAEIRKSLSLFLSIIDLGIDLVTLSDNERVYTADKTELVDLVSSLVILSRAHEESAIKSHRSKKNWESKRKNASTRKMTAMAPAWLKLSKDRTHFEPISARVKILRRIFEESAAGMGIYVIAKHLNRDRIPPFGRTKGWPHFYVSRILKSRSVLGEMQPHKVIDGRRVPDGVVIPDYYPSVVPEDLYFRAQQGMSERRLRGGGRKGPRMNNLFTGLISCFYCGGKVKFEGRSGAKGRPFLMCDSARRGLGCEATSWRYDQFETSMLSFCSEIDLELIIHNEDESKRRSMLEGTIVALRGQQVVLKQQMDQAFELLNMGSATKFVGEKLKALEVKNDAIEKELHENEQELARLGTVSLGVEELRTIIAKVQTGSGEESYKLRSHVASRLRSMIDTILIASNGGTSITMLPDAPAKYDGKRYFVVIFRNGIFRTVLPHADDPTKFEVQTIRGKEQVQVSFPDVSIRVSTKDIMQR